MIKEKDIQLSTHKKFTEKYGGNVFYIYSIKENDKKRIYNVNVVEEIKQEIERLKNI